MGFFSFLFGNAKRTNVEVASDHIWMGVEAKFAGISKAVRQHASSETVAILLVAHFPDVFPRLEEVARQQSTEVPCQPTLASQLNAELAAKLHLDASALIDIVVAERHPLPSVDDELQAFAHELPCRCRLSHHLSLEDPVMQTFAGPWVQKMLQHLDMSAGEAIESPVVARRIRQAQEAIANQTVSNLPADSAAEWLEKNVPQQGHD